jgi:hypothetical protein
MISCDLFSPAFSLIIKNQFVLRHHHFQHTIEPLETRCGEEGAMHGTNSEISIVSVSRLEEYYTNL